jgi:hypothetical protein
VNVVGNLEKLEGFMIIPKLKLKLADEESYNVGMLLIESGIQNDVI